MVLHDFFISLMFFPYILRQYNVGMLFVCVLLPAILLTNSRIFPLQTKQRESYKRLNAQKKSSISQRCKISVCQIVLVSFSKKSREKRLQCPIRTGYCLPVTMHMMNCQRPNPPIILACWSLPSRISSSESLSVSLLLEAGCLLVDGNMALPFEVPSRNLVCA